jgi:alkanesulfonate monooxygenase SsuD/methylene tetrahydromethanopterin reductase-like flavin-dependent oxidoreductase (luciferase family)
VRVGISPFASSRAGFEKIAATAVAGGIASLWLGDGYLETPDFPIWGGGVESMSALAWLAGRFPQAVVGVSAAVLPLRDANWLAKQAMTLDQLTEGRFVLVVCPGFWDRELQHRGIDPARRAEVFERQLELLRAALGGPAEGEAERLSPAPFTPGGPPLWLAGGPATMRRALRLNLPFQASRLTPDELAPLAARWFDAGGGLLAHRVRVEIGPLRRVGEEVDWHALAGSADQVAEQLDRYRQIGVADLSLVPGQDDERSMATVAALVEEVLPQLSA